jgi:hypothetical protein
MRHSGYITSDFARCVTLVASVAKVGGVTPAPVRNRNG